MAFVLTPRFAPAYQAQCNAFGFCAPASQPAYHFRVAQPRPQRPQYSPFNHFFNQVDELLSEIDREAQHQAQVEAQREAHRQRQQRKRALRARFGVNQTEQGWQVDGEFEGFSQDHINIEVTDEHTLKISGNTRWGAEKAVKSTDVSAQTVNVEQQTAAQASEDKMDGVTLNEPDFETVTEADTATVGAATHDSDTESHKSYQATVEDDFEDLGAETSSLFSSSRPSSPAETKETKGKEKATEEGSPVGKTPVVSHPEVSANNQEEKRQDSQQEDSRHGSFERTFRFPERIHAANVSAIFKDGVLKVTVPRAQAQQVRRIAIL